MSSKKAKVLVVDDDDVLLEIYQVFLRDFQVYVAKNGEEAVRAFKFFKPDVVLMDISMPVMDDVEATKEILKADPKAVVIGVTAFAPQRGDELLKVGAKEILGKPFNRRTLIEIINKYLNSSPP
jgi:two-component system response regulator/two-component system chemotaxis response regulator CheY